MKKRTYCKIKAKLRFVEKAEKVHGNNYEYPDEYVSAKTKMKMLCRIHGEFLQTPDSHLQGSGCAFCKKNKGGVRYSTEQMVQRFKCVHGETFDYGEVNYKNAKTKVKIKCREHGVFEQKAHSHLSGCGCPKCDGKLLTEEDFLGRLSSKNFKSVQYVGGFTNMKQKCNFTCSEHGEFTKTPSNILNTKNGCSLCADQSIGKSLSTGEDKLKKNINATGLFNYIGLVSDDHYCVNSKTIVKVECIKHKVVEERRYASVLKSIGCHLCLLEHKIEVKSYTQEDFITKANDKHNFEYDYSNVKYKTSTDSVEVLCSEHGLFSVKATDHLQGQGCPDCRVFTNWSKDGYVKFVDKYYQGVSNLYVIRCYDEQEDFIKVGTTCRGLTSRFRNRKDMPYKYDVILEKKMSGADVYDLEKLLLHKFKKSKYKPDMEFGGKTECLLLEVESDVLETIKEFENGC